jgi:hypothetical protein
MRRSLHLSKNCRTKDENSAWNRRVTDRHIELKKVKAG